MTGQRLCHALAMTVTLSLREAVGDEAITANKGITVHISNNNYMNKIGYIYMMTNNANTVIYTGVTSDIIKRVYQHKNKLIDGFTKKYGVTKLVYFESCEDIKGAISREKQIKAGSRKKKIYLIESVNKEWRDLYLNLL